MSAIVDYLPLALPGLAIIGLIYAFCPPRRLAAWMEQFKSRPRPQVGLREHGRTCAAYELVPLESSIRTAALAGPLAAQAATLVPGLLYLWAPRLCDIIQIARRYEGTQRAIQMNNRLRDHRVALAIVDSTTLKPAGVLLASNVDNAAAKSLLRQARIACVDVRLGDPDAVREAFEQFGWSLPALTAAQEAAPQMAGEADLAFIRQHPDTLGVEVPLEPIALELAVADEAPPAQTVQKAEPVMAGPAVTDQALDLVEQSARSSLGVIKPIRPGRPCG